MNAPPSLFLGQRRGSQEEGLGCQIRLHSCFMNSYWVLKAQTKSLILQEVPPNSLEQPWLSVPLPVSIGQDIGVKC